MIEAGQTLARAADLMELDQTVSLTNALVRSKTQALGDLDASHALNLFLNFPKGSWHIWERSKPRTAVIDILRQAAAATLLINNNEEFYCP